MKALWYVLLGFVGPGALLTACHGGECRNGECECFAGQRCEFACEAPPCHVTCAENNPQCTGECANGDCLCGPGSSCELSCQSEPCHVTCQSNSCSGDSCQGSSCSGECGNGDCTCEQGSECAFTCKSGPCHVLCEGQNASCAGECANGACSCGEGSTCDFTCLDNNCSFLCEAGAECVARCPGGTPGGQGCAFTTCAAGTPEVCPDGTTLTCGAPCPPVDDQGS